MSLLRTVVVLAVSVGGIAAAPASAQFFFQPHDMTGAIGKAGDAGISEPLPGATEAEMRAALAWSMRAGLNVAALQCQFEPTLLNVSNYNAILTDHQDELKKSFDTVSKYFNRVNKGIRAGQNALDQFGTRTYSSFTTVSAQYGFCTTAAAIGRDALFTPRGEFGTLAEARMRELRNSLVPYGEQRFPRAIGREASATLPRIDAICWNKKAEWQAKKCGAQNWPPAGTGMATR